MTDGLPPPPPTPYGPTELDGATPRPANGLGVAGLVLGIVGTVLSETVVFGLLFGTVALVFGLVGRGRARRGAATNEGQALAGVVLGAVAVVASIVWGALYLWIVTQGCFSEGQGGGTCTF